MNTYYISKNMKTFLVSGNILSGSLKTRFKDSDLDYAWVRVTERVSQLVSYLFRGLEEVLCP